ncbi:hypothetical protein AVEN_57229-1 [Araneus ventricosus]|uniref:Uncharacterized protein n=1 Tax=Araneus ventricosus TaxID=182803 RepID=A0A4Y2JBM7_ARAVE|nr:hypothetical protein AVEN_57229-1 [Araneus ventricosus]
MVLIFDEVIKSLKGAKECRLRCCRVDSRLTGVRIIRDNPTTTTKKRKRRLRPLECLERAHSSQPFLLYWTHPADFESNQTPVRLL